MIKDMRKKYDGAFKLKIVLETYREQKTIAQIASEYKVHPTQICKWKAKFKQDGSSIFSEKSDREKAEYKELIENLYKQVGQLKVENDWLKKKAELIG